MNSRASTICLALVFQPLLAVAQQSGPQPASYEIESIILSCSTGEVDTVGTQVASAVGHGEFKESSLPKEATLISTPVVLTGENKSFEILVGPTEPVQYFEQQKDGSFQLRQVPDKEALGINIRYEVTTKPGNSDVGVLDAEFTVKSIRDREKIPDVNLDVGKPTILFHKCSLSLNLPLKKFSKWSSWFPLSTPTQDSTNAVLDLFRIRLGQQPDPRFLREIPAQQLNRGNGQ